AVTYATINTLHANQLLMIGQLQQILLKENKIMSALTDLQASQAALATAVQSAITDISNLSTALATAQAGNDDAGVEAVVTQLNTLAANLTAAVAPAVTPAPPTT
ncbi:MAG: hypothetical protein WCD69_27930, partial [Xanthobacteraceae bacterium]